MGTAQIRARAQTISSAEPDRVGAPQMNEPADKRPCIVIISGQLLFAELLSGALASHNLISGGFAGSAAEGVELCRGLEPDAVVLDYRLPDGEGLEAAEQILSDSPATRIILLTAHPSHELLGRAADLGICGLLPLHGTVDSLFDAIEHARPGAMVIHPSFLVPVTPPTGAPGLPTLSRRERQVLALLAEGCDVKTSAKRLNVTISTCRGYVKSVLSKLDAHTQLEAVAVARRMQLLEPAQPV